MVTNIRTKGFSMKLTASNFMICMAVFLLAIFYAGNISR